MFRCPWQLVFIDVLCRVSNYKVLHNNKEPSTVGEERKRNHRAKNSVGFYKSCHSQFNLEKCNCKFVRVFIFKRKAN
jgi:hypothetical protein